MRDPNRIRPFLEKIAEFWEKNPDWRFGQVFMNLSRDEHGDFQDPWEWEEDDWIKAMEEFRDEADMTVEELAEIARKRIPAGLIPEEVIQAIAQERYKQLHLE